MKKPLLLLLIVLFLGTIAMNAQRNFNEFNVIGVSAGLTLYDITTTNFTTSSKESYMFGFQMRGNVYNNFDMIYGISFYDTKIGILASNTPNGNNKEVLDYNLQSAQITVLWGYKILREHLSVEVGPILNINGKLTLKDTQFEDYIIDQYTSVVATDIENVSKVNFHLAGGLTAGFRNFRVFGQYQYGVTNMLNKLNSQNLENSDFKGNSSLITVGITAYF